MKVQVYLCGKCHEYESDEENFRIFIDGKEVIHDTSVFEWCHDCKEYDQENHCCHRWSKVIRKTIDECKQEMEEEFQKNQPKYPVMFGDGYYNGALVIDSWECPCCGKTYEIDEEYKYCPNCGQFINWENSEDTEINDSAD